MKVYERKKYVKRYLLLARCDWCLKLWFDGLRVQFFRKITGKYRFNRFYCDCGGGAFHDFRKSEKII